MAGLARIQSIVQLLERYSLELVLYILFSLRNKHTRLKFGSLAEFHNVFYRINQNMQFPKCTGDNYITSYMSIPPNNLKQYLPISSAKQRYYTSEEVSNHNTANDCWITLFGEVYNLTNLIQENISNALTAPLIEAAGTDITYWFDSTSREPRVRVNLQTGQREVYCPTGKYLHVQTEGEVKWWKNSANIIGKLTKKSKRIKIMNMINDHTTVLQVPCQQTIRQILNRYLKFNKHGASYIWKRLGRPLDMEKTLEQNGIEDEDPEFDRLDVINANWYIPVIHLFFSDDLTVA